ncbi:MAG: hypothetical protein EOL89_13220 [Actinobacteria bacterium]|nr:hypothetical protein [Actinomycetota bacterium]
MATTLTVRSRWCARAGAVAGMTVLGAVLGAAVLALVHLAGGTWVIELWFADAGSGSGSGSGAALAAALGAVAGSLFGAAAGAAWLGECLQVRLTARTVEVRWEGADAVVPRSLISAVVVGEDLVLLADGGVELVRVRNSLDTRRLRGAVEEAGLLVLPGDPHAAEFVPWDASDQLPDVVHRYLSARAAVLERRATRDAEFLRRELLGHGVAVRDVRRGRMTVQEWRPLAPVRVP